MLIARLCGQSRSERRRGPLRDHPGLRFLGCSSCPSRVQRYALAARVVRCACWRRSTAVTPTAAPRLRAQVETSELDGVLRFLTSVGIRSLTSRPPTLEELFLQHYTSAPEQGDATPGRLAMAAQR